MTKLVFRISHFTLFETVVDFVECFILSVNVVCVCWGGESVVERVLKVKT